MGSSHHTRGAPSGAVWCSKGFTNQHWENYVIREYFGHLERVFTYDFLFYYMYIITLLCTHLATLLSTTLRQ